MLVALQVVWVLGCQVYYLSFLKWVDFLEYEPPIMSLKNLLSTVASQLLTKLVFEHFLVLVWVETVNEIFICDTWFTSYFLKGLILVFLNFDFSWIILDSINHYPWSGFAINNTDVVLC